MRKRLSILGIGGVACLIALFALSPAKHSHAQRIDMETAERLTDMVQELCAARGMRVTGEGTVDGRITLRSLLGRTEFSAALETDIELAETLLLSSMLDGMADLTDEQLTQARACMEPHISRIVSAVLGE